VAEVRRWHTQDRGWKDIGYHFLIDRDGTLAEGRPLDQVGAHTQGHNTGTVGISLFGGHGSAATDQFSDHYTQVQDKALRALIDDLRATYKITKVNGHNLYAAKACPGFNVPTWLGKQEGKRL
jgi:N-acetyl-anhydromuramyl-L-alanine amidase AmpD